MESATIRSQPVIATTNLNEAVYVSESSNPAAIWIVYAPIESGTPGRLHFRISITVGEVPAR